MEQAQTCEENVQELVTLRRRVQDLQWQDQEQQQEIEHLRRQTHEQRQELERLHLQVQVQSQAQVYQPEQQLQGHQVLTEAKGREIHQLPSTVEKMEPEENHTKRDVQTNKHLVTQLQKNIQQKDRSVRDLQHTLSVHVQQLEQQGRTSSSQPQPLPAVAEIPQATVMAAPKDITKLSWKEGKSAPVAMRRGAAVVDENTVYFNPGNSNKVYSCQITSDGLLWSMLPDSHYIGFSLAVIDSLLTSVGGCTDGSCTNTLHSLTQEDTNKMQWSEVFPPMPTARSESASVTTEQALVVAGGCAGRKNLGTVEVMIIATKQWTIAECLPRPFALMSGAICGDQLYLGGGFVGSLSEVNKSVFTCSFMNLIPPQSLDDKLHTLSLASKPGVWREIMKLPVTGSTLTTLGGHLLAIGGWGSAFSPWPTSNVYCYNHQTDSWRVVTKMNNKRYRALSAVLHDNKLLTVGGETLIEDLTSVEIGSLPVIG